jgi:hypothetical protein
MALRIGGPKRQIPPAAEPMEEQLIAAAEEPMPEEDLMAELPPTLEEEAPMLEEEAPEMGVVDQLTAGYLGPEHGPFTCSNCVYFQDGGACQIVAGQIDPNGCCNLFTTMQDPEAMAEEPAMAEEEIPVEEPMPEVEESIDEGY